MNGKIFTILVICFIFSMLMSTGVFALEGYGDVTINVVDENNNTLEGAKIILGTYQMVQTDSTGTATFNNVEYGVHQYQVDYGFASDAYYTSIGNINVANSNEMLNIKLQPVFWLTGITPTDEVSIDGSEIYPQCEEYEFIDLANGDRLIYGLESGEKYIITTERKSCRQSIEEFQMERIYYYQAPFLPYYILKGNIIDSKNEMNINSGVLNVYDLLHNLIESYAITNGTFNMDLDYKYYQLEMKSEGYEDNIIAISPPKDYPEFINRDIYLTPAAPTKCTVLVNCVDIETGEFLAERIFEELLIADAPWALDLPTIENYTFINGEYSTDGSLTNRTFIAKYKKNETTQQTPNVKGSIVIKYIDSNNSIIEEEVIKDLQLGSHTVTAKVFEGYKFNDVDTKTLMLTEANSDQIVTFKYQAITDSTPDQTPMPITKGIITIQYIDEDSNVIEQETMNNLELISFEVMARNFDGYKLNDSKKKVVVLTESSPVQTVNFQYKQIRKNDPEQKEEPDTLQTEQPTQFGRVSGRAIDVYGNPIKNLRVELHSMPRVTFTNENGEYEFVDVELGEHTITVIDSRFQEVSKFEIILKAMNSSENIVLTNQTNAPLILSEEVKDREVDIVVTPKLIIKDEECINEKSIETNNDSDILDITEIMGVVEQKKDLSIPVKAEEPDVQPQQPDIVNKKLPKTGDSGMLETTLLIVFLLLGVWYFFLKKR